MTRADFLRTLAFMAFGATAARAQTGGHESHGAPAAGDASGSTAGFEAAMARMHEDMAIAYTGNADIDFARFMIPHHQGAIDMARVVIEHGEDTDIRAVAEQVIAAQTEEIAFFQDWLAANGG